MRVAPEGRVFIVAAAVICAVLIGFGWWTALAVWSPVTLWIVAFFRDPVRHGPRDERLVLAPADGKVVAIVPMEEPLFLQGPSTRVSIFMNVFNVHVNRYPADGTVAFRQYRPGKFFNAAAEKASTTNEQSDVGLQTPRGPVLVRQIAGLVARRIVTDARLGDTVRQGERMGLIRFGSRVDVFLPPQVQVRVGVGAVTRAGLTVLGEWP
jgi:phosphatidylserine decarboxylase